MEVTNGHCYLGSIELDYVLWEPLLALEYFIELAASDERHDKIETQLRLK
jgi:hypothetical protein